MLIKGYSISEWLNMLTEPIQLFFFNRRLRECQPNVWEKLNKIDKGKTQ